MYRTKESSLTYQFKFLPEVFIVPSIEERVAARARHRNAVSNEKNQIEVRPGVGGGVKVVNEIDSVQRQPKYQKRQHHTNQHLNGPLGSFSTTFLVAGGAAARPGPVGKFLRHLDVTKGHDDERHEKLEHHGGAVEDLSERLARPVLLAERAIDLFVGLNLPVQVVRERHEQGHQPDGHDNEEANGGLHSLTERIDDDQVAVDRDCGQRPAAHVHVHWQRKR